MIGGVVILNRVVIVITTFEGHEGTSHADI